MMKEKIQLFVEFDDCSCTHAHDHNDAHDDNRDHNGVDAQIFYNSDSDYHLWLS